MSSQSFSSSFYTLISLKFNGIREVLIVYIPAWLREESSEQVNGPPGLSPIQEDLTMARSIRIRVLGYSEMIENRLDE